jgi:nickel-dependent lactate racemase
MVLLHEDKVGYVGVGRQCSGLEYDQFLDAAAESMPLRGCGGKVVGLLVLCSSVKNAFGETQLATLKLIEGPAAVVLDNALLSAGK